LIRGLYGEPVMNILWKINFTCASILKWLGQNIACSFINRPAPVHVLFCLVDHFEPGSGNVPIETERERMQLLLTSLPNFMKQHRDSAGNLSKRTWFFPPHCHRNGNLRKLVSLCADGLGEVELHLHHGKTMPDTSKNLRKTIELCIQEYSHFGIFGTENGRKRYGFIHGDWALDNSRNNLYCGVNNELQILKETGCFADFTFPSLNISNPDKINSIYYALDDPNKAKSYNTGKHVRKNGKEWGDLMMIQGPMHAYFLYKNIAGLRIMGDAVNGNSHVAKGRIDLWVKTGIHVKGAGNVVIIKTHTHGAVDYEAVLGNELHGILHYLETQYNDGNRYMLHYVTARELFNIVKAIEHGEPADNIEQYRNYKIQSPVYNCSVNYESASELLKECVYKTYQ